MSQFSAVDASADPSKLISTLDHHASGLAAMKSYMAAAAARAVGPGRVVDVGCGAGHDLAGLRGAGLVAIGVDPSDVMVTECRRRHGPHGLARASGSLLPFRTASVDGCRIERVLMHVEDPATVLTEVARVVRPAGFLAVFEPDWSSFSVDTDLPGGGLVLDHFGVARHRDVGAALPDLVAAAGFAVLDVVTERSFAYRLRDLPTPVESAIRRALADPEMPGGLPQRWLEEQNRRDSEGIVRATWTKVLVVATRQ